MQILVAGATGTTGKLLVKQLLDRGHCVKAIVRSADSLLKVVSESNKLSIIQASILELSDTELNTHVNGCDVIVSCLGHNMSFKGIFGKPRWLVRDATRRLCKATKDNSSVRHARFILMNTTGYRNIDSDIPVSLAQKCVIVLLRLLVPPHPDNEQAAEYLRKKLGQNNDKIEWVVVRPDGLINDENVSEYELFPAPTRSAIFDAGKTSRINVAHFMCKLITSDEIWQNWQGQMPVIYNSSSSMRTSR